MASCCNCSAPLPVDSPRCSYCGTRNDMDFAAFGRFAISHEGSGRRCPYCEIPLQSIRLADGEFAIERCQLCFGLFFDPGELQAFLETSVAKTYEVNFREMANISRERGAGKDMRKVRYIQCPDCGKLMNRVNFGFRSGVVLDQCRQHGVWLDNGELIHLMEWKKAGGELLAEQKKTQEREDRQKAARQAKTKTGGSEPGFFSFEYPEDAPDAPLQKAIFLLSKFFR